MLFPKIGVIPPSVSRVSFFDWLQRFFIMIEKPVGIGTAHRGFAADPLQLDGLLASRLHRVRIHLAQVMKDAVRDVHELCRSKIPG
jgi:hypothetical protein